MLSAATSYDALAAGFRWDLPARYNIGVDTCDRHADDPGRTALIVEEQDGSVRDVGAEISAWWDFAQSRGVQAARRDTGMPRLVMMLITLPATLASVFCVSRVRA
jgi:hypothetical protein